MAERYIPEHRRTQYKAYGTFKPDELRRRRDEQQVEIRRQKRDENLAKRRGITGRNGDILAEGSDARRGAGPDSDDDGVNIENQVQFTSDTVFNSSSPCHYPVRTLACLSPKDMGKQMCLTFLLAGKQPATRFMLFRSPNGIYFSVFHYGLCVEPS